MQKVDIICSHGKGAISGVVSADGNWQSVAAASYDDLKARGFLPDASKQQWMFNHAVAFNHTAAILYDRGLFQSSPNKNTLAAPFIVNAAFAAEMFLKALSSAYGQEQTGHDLLALHRNLPRRAKSELDVAAREQAERRSLSPRTTFRDLLSSVDKAFVQWRYIFESDQRRVVNVREMIAALWVLHVVGQGKIWPGTPITEQNWPAASDL